MARAVFALALALAPGAWGVAAGRAPGRVLHRSRGAVRMADGALVDWLRASGATVSGVAQQRDGLLELQRDARPGEELVSVPDALHLSEASLRANVVGSFLDGWPMAAGEHAPLALALLHESFLADASPWAGYIRALPPAGEGSLDVPLLWSDAEQAELSASTTLPVRALLAELAADYAWLSAGPFAQAPDLFPPHVYSPQRYAWAHAVALSRAVRLDGKLVLAPGVGDVARSGSARGASASAERRQPSAGGFSFFGGGGGAAKPGAAVLVAREGARPGAPLALEADLSPAECLWAHGRLPVGRSGECELRLVVPPSDRLLADKAEVLSQAGLSTSQLWTLRSGALEREELLKYLRLVALRGAARAQRDVARRARTRARVAMRQRIDPRRDRLFPCPCAASFSRRWRRLHPRARLRGRPLAAAPRGALLAAQRGRGVRPGHRAVHRGGHGHVRRRAGRRGRCRRLGRFAQRTDGRAARRRARGAARQHALAGGGTRAQRRQGVLPGEAAARAQP